VIHFVADATCVNLCLVYLGSFCDFLHFVLVVVRVFFIFLGDHV